MKDLIDTVLEQINVGDCIVFSNNCCGVSYEFYQVVGKTPRSLKLRELEQWKHGNMLQYDCVPAGKDCFANDTVITARLKLCGSDAVSIKVSYGYHAFLYDKNNHLGRDGNPYQPDVYDWDNPKAYEGCCD